MLFVVDGEQSNVVVCVCNISMYCVMLSNVATCVKRVLGLRLLPSNKQEKEHPAYLGKGFHGYAVHILRTQ